MRQLKWEAELSQSSRALTIARYIRIANNYALARTTTINKQKNFKILKLLAAAKRCIKTFSYSFLCRVRKTEQRRKRGVFYVPHSYILFSTLFFKADLLCLKHPRQINLWRILSKVMLDTTTLRTVTEN